MRELRFHGAAVGVQRRPRLDLHLFDVAERLLAIGNQAAQVGQPRVERLDLALFIGDESFRLIDLRHRGGGFARRRHLIQQSLAAIPELAMLPQAVVDLALALLLRRDLLPGLPDRIHGLLPIVLERGEARRERVQPVLDAIHLDIVRLHVEQRGYVRFHDIPSGKIIVHGRRTTSSVVRRVRASPWSTSA